MAKKVELKERGTGETMYPVTDVSSVKIDSDNDLSILTKGKDGQVLRTEGGVPVWKDYGLLDLVTYGVEWKPNVADPQLTRVGNPAYHKTLPIQSQMAGCVYDFKKYKIAYFLDDDNWFVKRYSDTVTATGPVIKLQSMFETLPSGVEETITRELLSRLPIGSFKYFLNTNLDSSFGDTSKYYTLPEFTYTSNNIGAQVVLAYVQGLNKWIAATDVDLLSGVTYNEGTLQLREAAFLNGYDGEVMVYVPDFWIKSWDEEDRRCVRICNYQYDDTWEYQPAILVSAYKNTVLNTVPENFGYLSTLPVNSAVSIANSSDYCRGGLNNADYDTEEDIFKSQLGKCRSNINIGVFRDYARNANKEIMSYRQYKNIMYWLYVIEYANFNSQAPYTPELTVEGFHQGGLGIGITNVNENSFIGSDGNNINLGIPVCINGYTNDLGNGTGIKLINSTTIRPIGNIYATRWRGIENPFGDTGDGVDGLIWRSDGIYSTTTPSSYGVYDNDTWMLCSKNLVKNNGTVKEWDLGSTSEIIPREVAEGTNQYKCVQVIGGTFTFGSERLYYGSNAYNYLEYSNCGIGQVNTKIPRVTLSNHMLGYRTVSSWVIN